MPFRDIFGHRRLVDLLARSIERGTLPPSLIFAGPRGIGKRRVAIAAAQALNCTAPRKAPDNPAAFLDACGSCAACSRIERGVHPDVLIVEPGETGSIKIEQVREIVDRVGYRPFEGRRRVVVIDQADALAPAAQSALLKTLEEPPASSVFILVTARADTLLPTVQSRCPRLRFRPLGADEVAAALVAQGQTAADARTIAATAQGSIGQALDASAAELRDACDIAVRVLQHAAAGGDERKRIEGARHLLAGTAAGGAGARRQLSAHLRAVAAVLRDVALLSTGADERALAHPLVRPSIERLSAFHGDRGIEAFSAVDEALVALERNASVKIVADWVMLHL